MNFLQTNKYMVLIAFTYMTLRYLSRSGTLDRATLRGTRVIVTGASSGIGRETALLYCGLGASVFITARREEMLQDVIGECEERRKDPGSVYGYIAADMDKMEDTEKVIKAAVETMGGIDTLIINHAYIPLPERFTFTEAEYADMEKIFRVNLFSFVQLTGHAMPHLLKTEGRIGLVASVAGRLGAPFLAPYSATKFAIDGFFSSLDMENYFEKNGVSITIIYPGIVDTGIMDPSMEGMERLGMDTEKLLSYLPPGDANECGYEIIRATSLRLPMVYYPPKQRHFLATLIRHTFPSLMKTDYFMKK